MALTADGALAVGTGDAGRLYRVSAAGAKPETSVLADINETHVISLALDRQGNLIAGTDPSGLVLRVSPDGKVFALFDSPLREVHALAPAADGSVYALALSDAASGPRPVVPSRHSPTSQGSTQTSGGVSVTITSGDIIEARRGARSSAASSRRRAAATTSRTRAAPSSASSPTAAPTCSGVPTA